MQHAQDARFCPSDSVKVRGGTAARASHDLSTQELTWSEATRYAASGLK